MVSVQRSLSPNGVLWLTLDRPERLNAMNDEMAETLRVHVDEAAADAAVRTVVLTGNGRAFCAGGDIGVMRKRSGTEAVDRLRSRAALVRALVSLPKPLIAAVNGPAVGGGFSLALASDIIIAGRDAYFSQAFLDLGLAPDLGYSYFLARQVGTRRAMEITLSGRRMDAAEALVLGIAAHVCETHELIPYVTSYAAALAERSAFAVSATKQLIAASTEHDLSTAMELEAMTYGVAVGTSEHLAAVERFRAGRNSR